MIPKILVALNLITIIVIMMTTFIILNNIQKHSVHPLHGNVMEASYQCMPWDSCK